MIASNRPGMFYHIKNLQSTKTCDGCGKGYIGFYHIKNLQSTKTSWRDAK